MGGEGRAKNRRGENIPMLKLIPPGLIVSVLAVLIVSQLLFAFVPYRRRAYIPILMMTATGFALGQLWDFLGLPSVRTGQANVLPAIVFALLLQPLARFVPRPAPREREPKPPEPRSSNPSART
jgi:hypothetical protein